VELATKWGELDIVLKKQLPAHLELATAFVGL
jgi:hypothetical protein